MRLRPRSLAYLGTPAMSVPPLEALHAAGFEIRLVVTNPDRRRGRGRATQPSPVKEAATALGIPVSHEVDDVLAADVDLGVVVAFGQIIRPHVLAAVPMVNLHFSLLPRWRGAAPVERAILAGDERTGVDLMVVEEGLDTGGVLARTELPIGPDEYADRLRERLVDAGTHLLVGGLRTGLGDPVPQVGEPVYAHKLTTEDLHIDWSAPMEQIHRQVRVGGAWTTWNGKRFKIWRTARMPLDGGIHHPTGTTPIELLEVQPAGKPRMDAEAWARGARWSDGDRLGT
ncbi:MAG TPA: methionyl-tRNA formyltransferase [Acidimicrobiales bacterium]|nr:methionyl-tRNA formyltransferase [Acidimicrobiales bacterium]